MKRNALMLLAGLAVAVLFVLLQVVLIVREGEAAVLTTFGKPERALTEAGLYFRWPWPVQRAYRFDARVHCLEGLLQEVMTEDGKNVLLSVYAGWKISDPVLFLERVGGVAQAESNLDGLLRSHKNAIVGQIPFSGMVNPNPDALRFEELETRLLSAAQPEALSRYGIAVEFVGVRKLELPGAITEKVFDRMRAERNELAERYRSEGEAEAIRIRAEADRQRDQLLAQAEADAKRAQAEGDAEAAAFYQAFERNPDLAIFLRKLEVLENTLQEKSTVVLGADTEPYDLLRGMNLKEAAPKRR